MNSKSNPTADTCPRSSGPAARSDAPRSLSPRALYQEVADRLRQQIFAARWSPAAGSTSRS